MNVENLHNPHAPILKVSDLCLQWSGRDVLLGLSFAVNIAERIAVVGPNGAGKSTLFKVIAGVIRSDRGAVEVAGHGAPGKHICIAYLPQRAEVDWNFPVRVRDVVMMGRVGRLGLLRRPKKPDRDLVNQCLEVVELKPQADRQISELSGGQQQRMFIAQALAQEAEIMLMDEPFSGLDHNAQDHIFRILDDLKARCVTVMLATHDLDMAAAHFDRVMLINTQMLGLGPPKEVFTAELLKQAYGHHLQMVDTENGTLLISDTCCDGGHSPS